MPRGKYVNHKGRSRRFTSPEELQQDSDSEEGSSSGEENEEGGAAGTSKSSSSAAAAQNKAKSRVGKMPTSSEDESDESDEDDYDRDAKKGVASLIEIENPNRAVKKTTQKINNLSIDGASNKPELTRREREQLEKQKAKARYDKLHAAGKTTEAKADLARLALVRQQRAEAAAKREAEKKALEDKKAPTSAGGKA